MPHDALSISLVRRAVPAVLSGGETLIEFVSSSLSPNELSGRPPYKACCLVFPVVTVGYSTRYPKEPPLIANRNSLIVSCSQLPGLLRRREIKSVPLSSRRASV